MKEYNKRPEIIMRNKEYYLENKQRVREYRKRPEIKERRKRYFQEYRHRNKEKLKIYNKKYKLNNKERINKAYLNYQRENKEKLKIKRKKYNKNNPKKVKARNMADYHSPLKSFCEICNSSKNLQRHHWSYDKPLLVNTLCQDCHRIQHIKNFKESIYNKPE